MAEKKGTSRAEKAVTNVKSKASAAASSSKSKAKKNTAKKAAGSGKEDTKG